MSILTPLGLIEDQLNEWIKAKRKSEKAFNENLISLETHSEHINNLDPLIAEWTEAVELFKEALAKKKQ